MSSWTITEFIARWEQDRGNLTHHDVECLLDELSSVKARNVILESTNAHWQKRVTAFEHGLASYAYGNASPDLAKELLNIK